IAHLQRYSPFARASHDLSRHPGLYSRGNVPPADCGGPARAIGEVRGGTSEPPLAVPKENCVIFQQMSQGFARSVQVNASIAGMAVAALMLSACGQGNQYVPPPPPKVTVAVPAQQPVTRCLQ